MLRINIMKWNEKKRKMVNKSMTWNQMLFSFICLDGIHSADVFQFNFFFFFFFFYFVWEKVNSCCLLSESGKYIFFFLFFNFTFRLIFGFIYSRVCHVILFCICMWKLFATILFVPNNWLVKCTEWKMKNMNE